MFQSKIGLKIVIVISIATIITITAFGFLSYLSQRQYLENTTTERYLQLTIETMEHIDHNLFERERSALLLSQSHTPRHFLSELYETGSSTIHPLPEVNEDLSSFSMDFNLWSSVSLVDTNAIIQASSRTDLIDEKLNGLTAEQIKDVIHGNTYISDFTTDPYSKNYAKLYAFPIKGLTTEGKENIVVGFLVAYLPISNIEDMLTHLISDLPAGLNQVGATLISKDGSILSSLGDIKYNADAASENLLLASSQNHEQIETDHKVITDEKTGKQVSIFSHLSKGYKDSAGFGGILALELDTKSLFEPIYSMFIAVLPYNIIITFLVCIFVIMFLHHFVIKPTRSIAHAINEMNNGKTDVEAEIFSQDEIGQMALSFNDLTHRLRESNQILEKEVQERTNELKVANQSLESRVFKRTEELQKLKDSLEQVVTNRTKELNDKVEELEKINKLMIGRELKMISLKEELKKTNQEDNLKN